jgi:hypothetical protein
MKVLVSCCADCPFKKVAAEVKCKLSDLLLLSSEPGGVDYISERAIHPDCKLLTQRVVVVLDQKTRHAAGRLEAFIGNRILLRDGKRGAVVAKFKDADAAGVSPEVRAKMSPEVVNGNWYLVLLDGHQMTIAAESFITEIIKEQCDFNYNPDFEYYFGFGEGDDEK